MADIPDDQWKIKMLIEAAHGYYELGMLEDAWEQVSQINSAYGCAAPVLRIKLMLFLRERRWEEALDISREFQATRPDLADGYIHAAFCLHEMGETHRARSTLLSGPPMLSDDPLFHYNLACYHAVLGEEENAREALGRAVDMDKKLSLVAAKDPDLASLRDPL